MILCQAAVSLLGLACSSKEAAPAAPVVTVQVATAERAPIERRVTADAILYPLHQATIVPKISAPVSKFYVQRGSLVRAGQLLATLESRDLAAAATESQGAYEQAQAVYQTAVNSDVPETLQKVELDVKAARQALDAQRKVFNSDQTLFNQGAIPRKQLEDSGVLLTQAQNQYEIAQKHLKALLSFANQDAVKAAKGQLVSAQGRYEAAQAQLSYAEIHSPIDGVVTDRPLYPGEMATPASPLLTIMDLSRVVARAHVTTAQAALLKPGDPATIEVSGQSAPVPARVSLVSPALDPNSTTVEVWAEAANPHERLQPGSSARVTLVAETVPDALVIPASALITSSAGATAVILAGADGKPLLKTVKVGIRQDDKLQITDGLQPGDQVVSQGAFELAQEDPDLLARTRLRIAGPASPGSAPDSDKDSAQDP